MALDYDEYDRIMAACKVLSILKNKQYGARSLKLFDGIAILARMNDKIERLNNLMWHDDLKGVKLDESTEDTCLDLINYAAYLIMLKNDKLEKVKQDE